MKTNTATFFCRTVADSYNKSTKTSTITVSSPNCGQRQLVVIQDTHLNNAPTVNPHEFRTQYQTHYQGSYFREDSSEVRTVIGKQFNFNDTPVFPTVSSLRNEAIGELYNELRSGGVGSGLDIAVDIAEAHQVKKMVKDGVALIGKIGSFYHSVRNLRTDQIAKAWLAYQYGVRPLVSSVYGTFDALMHRRLYQVAVIKGKARARSWSQSTVDDRLFQGSREILTSEWRSRYMVVGEFQIRNTVKQQLGGYTSLNPVSIAWELFPYSFVLDWVIDVGGYLRALEGALAYGQQFVRGYEVAGYRTKVAGTAFSYRPTIAGVTQIVQGEGVNSYTYKTRFPLGVWPCPTLPQFNASLGWQRLVSAASLLRVQIKGK